MYRPTGTYNEIQTQEAVAVAIEWEHVILVGGWRVEWRGQHFSIYGYIEGSTQLRDDDDWCVHEKRRDALEKSRHVTTCEECESPGAYSNKKEKKGK